MKISWTALVAPLLSLSSGSLAAAVGKDNLGARDVNVVSVVGGQTFKVHQVPNTAYSSSGSGRGPLALAKAYSKYGISLSQELQEILDLLSKLGGGVGGGSSSSGKGSIGGNQTASTGTVAATPQMSDSEYLAAVSIGTPPQTLMLDFDTGSSDLWVFTSETPKSEEESQRTYNIQASSTAQRLANARWSILYGDGSSAGGDVVYDTVSIGNVKVEKQAVESAQRVTESFTVNSGSSGLLGLAMDKINNVSPTKQKTFFSNAKDSLAMPVFTANLKHNSNGTYNFGFIDPSEHTGEIVYVAANTSLGFWGIKTSGFAVGQASNARRAANATETVITSSPHDAIVDTGTTLLMLPQNIVDTYYRQVPSAKSVAPDGSYTFDCNAALPDLTLAIGTYRAVVPGKLINFSPVSSTSSATCFGGLQSNGNMPFSIYGDIFLKSQFVVFNGGSNQIGFAPQAG